MPAVVNTEGPRFRGFTDQELGATAIGTAYHAWGWRFVGAHAEWTGTNSPVGVVSFEGSNNSTNGIDGDWRPVSITITNQPDGSADGELIDLTGVPWEWIRPVYTRTSAGEGALLNLWFSGKGRLGS